MCKMLAHSVNLQIADSLSDSSHVDCRYKHANGFLFREAFSFFPLFVWNFQVHIPTANNSLRTNNQHTENSKLLRQSSLVPLIVH